MVIHAGGFLYSVIYVSTVGVEFYRCQEDTNNERCSPSGEWLTIVSALWDWCVQKLAPFHLYYR